MSKSDHRSEHERIRDLENMVESLIVKETSNIRDVASIINYKLDEFVRLGSWEAGLNRSGPLQLVPNNAIPLLASIATFAQLVAEFDRVRGKIQAILDTIQPPDPGTPGMPVPAPVPPTPGTQKMREALDLIQKAMQDADNLDPESAKQKLEEAKNKMRDADVRKEFRKLRQARSWYDILEELQAMIDYLAGVLR